MTDELAESVIEVGVRTRSPIRPTNPDYIERGSMRHAAFLGLIEADDDDEPQYEGWTLADLTLWGPTARPEFLRRTLKQKVNELNTEMPEMQSDDPSKPFYAPPIWTPDSFTRDQLRGAT